MLLLNFLPEFLQLTIQSLLKTDLLAVRLSCKYLLDLIGNRPFRTIIVEGNLESFQRLKDLSDDPVRSKHVKQLIYSGLFLGGDSSLDPYFIRNLQGENQWQTRKSLQLRNRGDDYHYHRYCQILQSQQLMQTGHTDVEHLTYCMKRLPNLREVEFCSGGEKLHQTGGEMAPFEAFTPKAWDHNGPIARETLVHPDSLAGKAFHPKQFQALLDAAKSNSQIEIIRAFGLPSSALVKIDPPKTGVSAQHCRHLVLNIRYEGWQRINFHALRRFLGTAQQLKILHLSFGLYHDPTMAPLGVVFGSNHVWQNLTVLSLVNIISEKDHLCAVLGDHKWTLQNLQLQHVRLTVDHGGIHSVRALWISFISFLRIHLRLKSVRLRGWLNGIYGWHVHGASDRCPECPQSRRPEDTLTHQIEQYITAAPSSCCRTAALAPVTPRVHVTCRGPN